MRCPKFTDRLNKLLDQRTDTLCGSMRRHAQVCDRCRNAWETLRSCEQALAPLTPTCDRGLATEVLSRVAEHSPETVSAVPPGDSNVLSRNWVGVLLALAVVLALIFINPWTVATDRTTLATDRTTQAAARQTETRLPISPPSAGAAPQFHHAVSAIGMWRAIDKSPWYEAADMPPWDTSPWATDWKADWPTDESLPGSVAVGLRPVAASVGNAWKVIRQNVLPSSRSRSANGDGQALLRIAETSIS